MQGIVSNSIEPVYYSRMAAQLPSAMIKNGMICGQCEYEFSYSVKSIVFVACCIHQMNLE